jgi:acyl-CoA dehydrogenase family member 10
MMTALRGSRVPVPRTYCLCEDVSVIGTAFFIMDYVKGRLFKDITLPGMRRQERYAIYYAMVEVLAELHKIDFRARGLDKFGRQDDYVGRQVRRWSKQYEAAKTSDVPQVNNLIAYLKQQIPTDGDSKRVTIVHGDFRLDNMIFHPTQPRVIAVLDWELSTLGHPTADLAYNCMAYHLPAGQKSVPGLGGLNLARTGIPTEGELVAAYHRQMKQAGPIANYNYFMALSFFRLASIGQGVYKRYLQGNASQPSARLFEEFVPLLAKLGLKCANRRQSSVATYYTARDEKVDRIKLQPFGFSKRFYELREKLLAFMNEHVYPNEYLYEQQHHQLTEQHGHPWVVPPIMETLKARAKSAGLWNLFMTKSEHHNLGPGLTNLEYAPLCEIMGRVLHMAPEIFNCAAPDTGNMEVLARYGTAEQQRKWLVPLMNGDIRSCFGMTEPMVASSDATNIECRIERDGEEYVINGRKWWTSGAMDPRCKVCILMGKTDPNAPRHRQQSMILVPMDAPGVNIERALHVFGYTDAPHGHAEVEFKNVRVPASNMLLGEGRGFEIAQGRLGPGRIHHCMRTIGMSERALEYMVRRVMTRTTFGTTTATKGTILHDIAESRIEIEQCRLLTLQAASMMDTVGNKHAKQQIGMIKVAAPSMACRVLDRAIQAFGGMGVCQDTPLANLYAQIRTLRLADGPDEVHRGTIAKQEFLSCKL